MGGGCQMSSQGANAEQVTLLVSSCRDLLSCWEENHHGRQIKARVAGMDQHRALPEGLHRGSCVWKAANVSNHVPRWVVPKSRVQVQFRPRAKISSMVLVYLFILSNQTLSDGQGPSPTQGSGKNSISKNVLRSRQLESKTKWCLMLGRRLTVDHDDLTNSEGSTCATVHRNRDGRRDAGGTNQGRAEQSTREGENKAKHHKSAQDTIESCKIKQETTN